jgi:tRNA pseudouridine13 synthase
MVCVHNTIDLHAPPPLTHTLPLSPHISSIVHAPLSLGQLKGNRFEIVLRDIKVLENSVNDACTALRNSGFINYFGLQRFGRGGATSGSHLVGREVFKKNWKAAIEIMFSKREGERSEILEAKDAFWKGDYEASRSKLPRMMYSEISILERLIECPKDYAGAYGRVPRSTQLLCNHAFQSYVFNHAATYRSSCLVLSCFCMRSFVMTHISE